MLVHRRVTPSIKFAGTLLYTWVERDTVRVKCLAQEHNIMSLPGLEPGLLDPETSALTSIHAFVLTSYTSYPVVFGQQFERSTYVCKRLVFKTIFFFFFFCSFLKVCMIWILTRHAVLSKYRKTLLQKYMWGTIKYSPVGNHGIYLTTYIKPGGGGEVLHGLYRKEWPQRVWF